MKQKVVVIGHGYTSRLGLIRALGSVGYEVIVIVMTTLNRRGEINTEKPIDCYSKYVSQIYYCLSDREKLVSLLLDKCIEEEQKVVVIPDSDFSVATIDLNQDRLKDYFIFPHINHEQGTIVSWMNKVRQKEVARSIGLNVADGWVVEVVDGEYTIPKEIKYPCFPKPLATIVGGKGGLRKCNNEIELTSVIELLIKRKQTISILVEEYKEIEVEHALLGFSDGGEVIIPGIIQTISLANGGHFGVAKQGKIMPINGFEDLIDKFKRFVLQTGFVGIFDIDFYKSDGDYYFCEMNFRYGGSGYAYTAMGVNLPDMLVRTLTGKTLEGMNHIITKEAIFINERMCKDDWVEGYISTKAFRRLMRTADVSFVADEEDRVPQQMFDKSLCKSALSAKRIAKKIIKRR